MIVEVPVIGALALHVLFYVKEGSFSLFELPVKQLQFSPCPFHSIPASIHLDLAGFGKCEPGFAEPERLCKRDHLTLALVHSDSSGFKTPYNFMAHQLCFIHRGKESIVPWVRNHDFSRFCLPPTTGKRRKWYEKTTTGQKAGVVRSSIKLMRQ